jgi:hypothetical protein
VSQRYREEVFEPIPEPWSVYVTNTGLRVRVRQSVVRIRRLLDEQGTPMFMPDGVTPSISVDSQLQVVAEGEEDETKIAGSSKPF